MPITLNRTAEITVGLSRGQAMALFTAEGERRWAEGWEPHYPQPARRDGAGAVFTTGHGDHQTTWIMVDHRPERIRYARVSHGMTAGTVTVEPVACDEHTTRVRVSYDLTALGPAGESWLAEFGEGFDVEIGSWATDIATAIRTPG